MGARSSSCDHTTQKMRIDYTFCILVDNFCHSRVDFFSFLYDFFADVCWFYFTAVFICNFIAMRAGCLGTVFRVVPTGGVRGHSPPPPSVEKLIFNLWKVNFLWSYKLKFQIFCACGAYRHPRNCYKKMLLVTIFKNVKLLLFSSKKLRIFVKNTQTFRERLRRSILLLPFWYNYPPQTQIFSTFFTPFDIFFDKKFRACPPPVRNFWVRAWPSYLWHGPSSAPPCAGEFGRMIRNIRHHSVYPYGHLNCF